MTSKDNNKMDANSKILIQGDDDSDVFDDKEDITMEGDMWKYLIGETSNKQQMK